MTNTPRGKAGEGLYPPPKLTSVLLIRLGGLGDLLTVAPCVSLIRRFRPDWRLTLACREVYGFLLKESGLVDETADAGEGDFVRFFSGTAGSPKEGGAAGAPGFDLILGWMQSAEAKNDLDQAFRGLSFPRVRLTAFNRPDMIVSRFFFLKTLEFLADDAPVPGFEPDAAGGGSLFRECARLQVPDSWKKKGQMLRASRTGALGMRFAVVHPGSGSRLKRWPLENFLAAANALSAQGVPGIFITGDAEEEDLAPALERLRLPQSWSWARRPEIQAVAGLLAEADFYLGNDSGVTHLAAACACAGVAVFRKDLERNWTPAGDMAIVSSKHIHDIPLAAVLERVQARLKSL